MNNEFSTSISFNTDDDSFLSQECPTCLKLFKAQIGEGSDQPISFCPYCGHQGQDCWWTQEQADYITEVASKEFIEPQLEKMARDFNRQVGSSGLISINMQVKGGSQPNPPQEQSENWPIILFDCCNERIKHDRSSSSLYCIICGRTAPITKKSTS